MNQYRFHLKKYDTSRRNNKLTCPECGKSNCFVKYVDEEGVIVFPDYVGRCDHENACGYHYTPTHTVLKPQPPQTVKGMFAYLFLRLPWYHIKCFFTSSYFKHWLIIIMVSVWFVSVFLACIMAIDNAKMQQMYNAILIHS